MTLAILVTAAASLAAQHADRTSLDLVYPAPNGTVFDANCADMLKTTLRPEAVAAAVRRLPEFQTLWDRESGAYLAATYAEIGLPFPYREMQATLTVCPGVRSMSAPLFLNVSRFLPTAETRAPDWYFVKIAYHELMHTYVRRAAAGSQRRKKYAGEAPVVLTHLHVMALEKVRPPQTRSHRRIEIRRSGLPDLAIRALQARLGNRQRC